MMFSKDNLFKKSIIFIKAWCLYETRILGSQNANFSSYAIEVMIIYLLNNYYEEAVTPLDVLRLFVRIFSRFNWANYILTIFGPIPMASYETSLLYVYAIRFYT